MIMPDQEAPATFDEIRAAAEFTPAASGSQGLKDGVMLNRQAAILRQATTLDEANSPATAQALRDSARALAPDLTIPDQEDVPEGMPAEGNGQTPSGQALAGEEGLTFSDPSESGNIQSTPEEVEYFNFVMGERDAASETETLVARGKQELDAELNDVMKRFRERRGPAIQLEPIPLAHPDRIYLDQLPLKNPDRILLEPMDVGDLALYGRGLSVEGSRILLDRVKLTRQAGPNALPPPKMDETALLQARAEGKLQNDNQQPTESSQSQVPVPAVPGSELAADPASEAVAAPAPAPMDAGVAAKTPTLTPEARSSIDREVSSAKVALTSVAHKRAVVAELEVALKDVKVPMTTKVDGKNATAQFEESGAKMVAQLKRDKDAYKALADCLGSK
jgi:hypothetical protein